MYSNGDVTDNDVCGLIKDTKIKTYWEWNINFFLNEKVHLLNIKGYNMSKN